MRTAELEIQNLPDGRVEIYLRIFDFELSGKAIYEKADAVDLFKIINPVQEELDWEKQITLTKKKEEKNG